MITKLFDKNIKKNIPFLVFFCIVAFSFSFCKSGLGDDSWYTTWTFRELINRYFTYHGKIVIDFLLIVFLRLPHICWVLMSSFLFTIMAYSVTRLLTPMRTKDAFTVVLTLGCYPLLHMWSAGWYATSINYLWPCSLGFFSLLPIKDKIEGSHIRNQKLLFAIIAIIISCNQEQMAAIIFSVYFLFIAFFYIKEKKIDKRLLTLGLMSFISLLFLLLSPGTKARLSFELHWYPAYEYFGLKRKIFLGLVTTIFELFFNPNSMLIVFCIVLGAFSLKHLKGFRRICGIFPLVFMLMVNVFVELMSKAYPHINSILDYCKTFQISYGGPTPNDPLEFNRWNVIAFFLACMLLLSIIVSTCSLYSAKREKQLLVLIILLGGFTSRIIIGFSPTIYVSSRRTFIYLYMALACIIILLIKDDNSENYQHYHLLLGFFSIISFANMISYSLFIE